MKQKYIKDNDGNKILPITSVTAVRDANGQTLAAKIEELELKSDGNNNLIKTEESRAKNAESSLHNSVVSTNNALNTERSERTAAEAQLRAELNAKQYEAEAIELDAVPTKDSTKMVNSGTVYTALQDMTYDVSVKHPASGVDSGNTYTLSGAIAVIPADYRKGGMSIKFIQSSDNNYIQARLMADSFTTDVTQWQCSTDEIKAGSKDLAESGAVERVLYHHYGTKDVSVQSSGGQTIFLREFDYGNAVAARITGNTTVFGEDGRVSMSCRFTDSTSFGIVLSSEWKYIDAKALTTIDRVYIAANGAISTAGTISVEVIFKDAFYAIVNGGVPNILSNHNISSKGVYPFATSAFKHQPGKNLCNPKDPLFKLGVLLTDGIEYDGFETYGVTGYIPALPTGLVLNHYNNSHGFAVYDSSYNYLRTVNNTSGIYTYVAGDAYVRFNFPSSSANEIMVEEGSTSSSFEEYNPVYGQINAAKNEIKAWTQGKLDEKADVPVGPDEINFLHHYNMFNKSTGRNYEAGITPDIDDNIWNCYLYNNGFSANNDLSVTAYMAINESDFFAYISPGTSRVVRYICYYDADKVYMSTETVPKSDWPAYYTPPEGAYYARITFYTSYKDSFMVTLDTTPSEYVPYSKYTVDDIFLEEKEEIPMPEAVFPSTIYALIGEQNSIYHNEYINCYNPYAYYLQKVDGCAWTYHERCWRRESIDTGGSYLKFALKDRLTKSVIQNIDVSMQTAAGDAGNTAIKVSCIGDSFCYGGFYLKQITDTCDNLTMVGMRLSNSYDIPCEGRGGWKLSTYMNPKCGDIALDHMQPFSPFMHAQGYNYYGVMEFWASIVNETSQYDYGTDGFDAYVSWFDSNGRKANPSENDLVYNQTAGKYEYYNGSAWVQLNTEPEFEFNYAKYLQIWQIDCPDVVVLEFGANDFYNNDTVFNSFKADMDIVINSINACATAQNKTIKIIITTVLTISGLSWNNYGDGYIEKSRKYWEMRKKTIEAFDTDTYRTTKHVYISDAGTSVDDKYGFSIIEEKPFDYYEGSEKEPYNNKGVHPSHAGYKQFGTCIAAAIQCLRT